MSAMTLCLLCGAHAPGLLSIVFGPRNSNKYIPIKMINIAGLPNYVADRCCVQLTPHPDFVEVCATLSDVACSKLDGKVDSGSNALVKVYVDAEALVDGEGIVNARGRINNEALADAVDTNITNTESEINVFTYGSAYIDADGDAGFYDDSDEEWGA